LKEEEYARTADPYPGAYFETWMDIGRIHYAQHSC
jgi:hypothetical protein